MVAFHSFRGAVVVLAVVVAGVVVLAWLWCWWRHAVVVAALFEVNGCCVLPATGSARMLPCPSGRNSATWLWWSGRIGARTQASRKHQASRE